MKFSNDAMRDTLLFFEEKISYENAIYQIKELRDHLV